MDLIRVAQLTVCNVIMFVWYLFVSIALMRLYEALSNLEDLGGRTTHLARKQVLDIDENVTHMFKKLYLMHFCN
jgi:hypothetical protein